MRDIFIVAKFTMRDMLSRKSYLISTLIVLVLIVVGFNVPNILSSFNQNDSDSKILVVDRENLFQDQIDSLNNPDLDYDLESTTEVPTELNQKIIDGDFRAAITIEPTDTGIKFDGLVKNLALGQLPTGLTDRLSALYQNLQIQKLNLSAKQLQTISPTFETSLSQAETEKIGGNLFAMMLVSIALFYAVYFCAFQVSSSITVEKTSKIMETLVTSTSPRTIVLGKTIGIGVVGLLQVLLFGIVAVISAYSFLDPELLNQMLDLSNFTPYLAIVIIVYFILGYFTYAFLYALTGSTVSKPEDIQSANTPVAILSMIGFYLAYFTLTNPTGDLNIVASLLPISSPFCMPLRVMMGIANGWDVVLSIIILLATCAIIAHIAIKIYSNAILNYGNRMTLRDIIKSYKEK